MPNIKQSSRKMATLGSGEMKKPGTPSKEKSLAGSVVSQARGNSGSKKRK